MSALDTEATFDAEITVRRTRFAQQHTGFAVVEAVADDGKPIVLVGPLVHLGERERAHVRGTWVNDSRYGPQVRVSEARALPPADAESLRALLRRVKHIGDKRAQLLVERYGQEHVFDAIDHDPQAAFGAAGLGNGRAREAACAWEELRATRLLHMLLAPHGLAYLAPRIHAEYGHGAHRIVREQPYELTSVFGVGFHLADRIAHAIGADSSSARARAGVLHLLAEAERGGSTCVPEGRLLSDLRELLGSGNGPGPVARGPGDAPGPADAPTGAMPTARSEDGVLAELERNGQVERQGTWIYRAQTAQLEAELAQRLEELVSSRPSKRLRAPSSEEIAVTGLAPNRAQLQALHHAFGTTLSLITGGPGTGKTASIRAIARCAIAQGAAVVLVAPTGRAAVRMSEAAGLRASTVHSALGWIPGEGPQHDRDHPLSCDLLIVDESSMANLELLVVLLRAVGSQTSVVLVGDADQLAPVGAGKPFAELVASGLVPVTRLTHIFRQAAGSMIVQGAHAIRRGRPPNFSPTAATRRDLFMIERTDPVSAREEIVSLVAQRLPAHYGVDALADIQVFAPVYRGELGIERLNEALRDALNPDGRTVRGGRLRIGDKVMLTGRNLHELGLMNGTLLRVVDEVGRVSGEDELGRVPRGGGLGRVPREGGLGRVPREGGLAAEGKESALLLSGEEAVFKLPFEEADRLALAYACSVHRGQGIELPIAVIVAHPAAGAFFLRREMLYTAITRAKRATVIVGTRQAVQRAARSTDTSARHSRLAERLGPLLRAPGAR